MQYSTMRGIGYPKALLFILSMASVKIVTSLSYCHQHGITHALIISALRHNIELMDDLGGDIDSIKIHPLSLKATCLASRGIDQYDSASLVAVYTVTVLGINQTMENQFQLSCNNGVWGFPTDRSTFDMNKPPRPFEIPLETQCSECTESLEDLAMPYYAPLSNCNHCHPDCRAKGTGYCTGPMASDCCPYIDKETGICVKDCRVLNSTFYPNNKFVCVPRTCFLNCPTGYVENSQCDQCEAIQGCKNSGQPCEDDSLPLPPAADEGTGEFSEQYLPLLIIGLAVTLLVVLFIGSFVIAYFEHLRNVKTSSSSHQSLSRQEILGSLESGIETCENPLYDDNDGKGGNSELP